MFRSAIAVSACVLCVGCAGTSDDTKIDWIEPSQALRKLNEQSLVVDTRSQEKYDQGHIPDARLVGIADIDEQSESPMFAGYRMILVYGQDPGSDAAKAVAKRLMRTKHRNVRLLDGGFEQWTREGLPVEIASPQSDGETKP